MEPSKFIWYMSIWPKTKRKGVYIIEGFVSFMKSVAYMSDRGN
jgi:hypothetical protein